MKGWVKDNGLTLALLALFAISLGGQMLTGWSAENNARSVHSVAPIRFGAYLFSGEFLSSLFENWESEFLQMWAYVMLTAYLFQRGSPESKDPDKTAPQDRNPVRDSGKPDAPWPVRVGGLARAIYAHSLGWTLLALFAASFVLHWLNSARKAADAALRHREAPLGLVAYLGDAEFWFESFQNWQSEFLSTAVLIVLAIFLRERGSPESKAVGDPHRKTGNA
ncbi:MAG: DUF6766 family protein [Pseudomonadota bacterium]